jgi:hypothetical protein
MPKIRGCALQHRTDARVALQATSSHRSAGAEAATCWDSPLVELLVQSGVCIEEASTPSSVVVRRCSVSVASCEQFFVFFGAS